MMDDGLSNNDKTNLVRLSSSDFFLFDHYPVKLPLHLPNVPYAT